MSDEFTRLAAELKEAKASYDIAEHNLAVARANLTRAERNFDSKIWRKITTLTPADGGGK